MTISRMSLTLPPGFRFHPTDVELVMYYLKRKVTGKKLHFEAISEINIHNFAPWDLPDKACLKGKDLEWFFFCPREKKYASGFRVKRTTDNGYWKITGKDRNVFYNDKIVGTVKTLVFHLGLAPVGKRTDWIIHEYRILDEELAATGAQADLVGKGKNIVLPGFDGNDINTSTNVQAHYTQINEAGIDFSVMQKDGLVAPVNFSAAVCGTEQFQMCDRVGSYFNENMQGGNLSGAAHYASCIGQLPVLPKESEIEGFLNVAQMENDNYYHGSNAAYASDFSSQPPVVPEESNMADSFLNLVQMENDNYYHGANAMFGLDASFGQPQNGAFFYHEMETGGYDDNL
ncbi:uncharacterized protein LOC142549550 isoform X1 [Primulina tabacum]|uniref:uncharacterized protein LOC142549550 isoform X1 n=1 Tax=Primulina tabacum TaxID=48773 RepID=UPI003F5A7CBA